MNIFFFFFFTSGKQPIQDKRSKLPFFGVDVDKIPFIYPFLEIDVISAPGGDFQGVVCKSTVGFSVTHPYNRTWVQSASMVL